MDAPASEVPSEDAAVVIEGATKRFGDDVAVDRISLTVRTGTILGIIGPSGSGKTTTIRLLTGALAPTEGQVRVLGEDPRVFLRQTRERIGYMPQQFTLYPDLTARENVDFVASLFGMLWRTRHRRTREVLQLVDLWDVRGRRAGRLSGGMQRRLELASALVHDPDLLFLDEPTAGIDPILRVKVWEELHRLRDDGRTLLVTTQYVNEAESCDTVALISGGRLIALARPEELRREALGGDIVEISTAEAFDSTPISDLPRVRSIERHGPSTLRVRVDDASAALPEVVEAITEHGGQVASASEVRPSFDEVFAILVERDRLAHGDQSPEAA
jgi:ABC-2 type transport system ATP-binding protein